jgi:hypothetical protein
VSFHRIDKYRSSLFQQDTTEFSASVNDTFNLGNLAAQCDGFFVKINNGESREIIPLVSVLDVLWSRLRVIVWKNLKDPIDEKMKKAIDFSRNMQNCLNRGIPFRPKYADIDLIKELYKDILIIRQNTGLGFSMRKRSSGEEALENIMK